MCAPRPCHVPWHVTTTLFVAPSCAAVNCQTELARIYNDTSVLESHHSATMWAVLARKDCALLVSERPLELSVGCVGVRCEAGVQGGLSRERTMQLLSTALTRCCLPS
jgi:hypothetical protein